MFTVYRLPEFDAWLGGLKDAATRVRLAKLWTRRSAGFWATWRPWAKA